ncbi:MAG: cell division protein FtsL [Gammaproteobacteria bacterium]
MLAKWSLLIAAVLASSLGVVYSKYQNRMLFIEIQKLEARLDRYEVEWGKLQLELTTHSEHSEIERLARTQLGMVMPKREDIIYIKP